MEDDRKQVITQLTQKIFALGHSVEVSPIITKGPIVTVYHFKPIGKTKVSNLEQMAQDFAVTLAVEDVLVRRLPGQPFVGVYVPNKKRESVLWRDIIGNIGQEEKIPLLLGIDINGKSIVDDLAMLPHLLIAGSTGSGKSTLLTAIIASLLYSRSEDDIQLVLNDTKGVEFGQFVGCPHLLFDEPSWNIYQFMEQLDWLTEEMNKRLKKIGEHSCKNVIEYNSKADTKLSYIVLVIDELADLLLDRRKSESEGRSPSLGKVVEAKLNLLVGRSRASGIHIIASTQRPSVKLIEGNIKANFPARITFRLPNEADSRTILGCKGAEHLLSQGDMLYLSPRHPAIIRIHAPYAPQIDISSCVEFSLQKRS